MRREFVAYDSNDRVICQRYVESDDTLEAFAAEHPENDVAEIVNAREVRTIDARTVNL